MAIFDHKTLELLAPARDYACGKAAVDFGADALYIGGPRFGARQAAVNSPDVIAAMVQYAHAYGVRVYVALNTLIYENELEEAERVARTMCECGADALIVQDMAYARMNLPIELHASTQTCNITPDEVRFWAEAGFARVILERGLTLEQIRSIRASTRAELEMFVHGAICVAYSGHCYMSRAMSERSGNRGACIQACRLPYDLLDHSMRPLMVGKHLLSVRDLSLIDRLGVLADTGICSFKIEGRLKEIGYVKNITAAYRRALDQVIAERPNLVRSSSGVSTFDFEPCPEKSFTRGFTHYFLDGKQPGVASFDTPKAIGSYVGKVGTVNRDHFTLDTSNVLHNGDGLCFLTPEGKWTGTNVNRAEGKSVWPNRLDGIRPGTLLYRNYDHTFATLLDRSRTVRKIMVNGELVLQEDGFDLCVVDSDGCRAEVSLKGQFERAGKPERMLETMRRQLCKTGDTIFTIDTLNVVGDSVPFVSVAAVNEARRDLLNRLLKARLDWHMRRKHLPFREQLEARYPCNHVAATLNVTNSMAEAFYRDHGVGTFETAPDRSDDLTGCTVMTMSYCLRRELGQCLREKPSLRGDLRIVHGDYLYDLCFDCEKCEMSVIFRGRRNFEK